MSDSADGERTSRLRAAVPDLVWLLDRGYPQSASVSIVGDRHRCTREERSMLFRGVAPTDVARRRSARRVTLEESTGTVWVDLYNTVLLLFNYRRGRPLFISLDGFVRDVGGVHGAVRDDALFSEELGALVDWLAGTNRAYVLVLDAPVSHSGDHAAFLRERALRAGVNARIEVEHNADGRIARASEGVVASADSGLIDRTDRSVCDLASQVLRGRFHPDVLDLRVFVSFPPG